MPRRPYVIGLTGNIACGKSLVLRELARLGAETIDADQVSRDLTQPGSPVLAAIVEEFGPAMLRPDGSLDRRALGAVVFRDPDALRRLEAITHPAIVSEIRRRIAASRSPVVVVDAIKLFEASLARDCDEVWVVTCRPEQQLARLMARDQLSEEEALARIRAQPPQAEKIARADVVIDNSGPIETTLRQVRLRWQQILDRLAVSPDPPLASTGGQIYTAAGSSASGRKVGECDATAETDADGRGSPGTPR